MKSNADIYLRNIIFGVIDSLVSTVGLLAGIDIGGTAPRVIIMTGIVYAFVEAFSMAVGSFLSEESTEEYDARGEVSGARAALSAFVMFVSFVLASCIPILPYVFLAPVAAFWVSIVASVAALFLVGLAAAKVSRVRMLDHAAKMALLGGAAILIGVIVGKFVKVS
ncbi:MAG: VIT1/CCC1 transporter family protein [Patescibacteria group bacterium]|nr:VIT1/CCC1 transporter family protein [Patescibacteria group bacterium]MDE1945633.1 VIT1/CCC1 transporter family protein [Patescibacteria group bacterium]